MFADIFAAHVSTLETQEGSAYGAALLALIGTGEYGSARELCDRAIKENVVKDPQPEAAKLYESHYQVFHSLYPVLRPAYRAISELDE
jgi:xylulokinase